MDSYAWYTLYSKILTTKSCARRRHPGPAQSDLTPEFGYGPIKNRLLPDLKPLQNVSLSKLCKFGEKMVNFLLEVKMCCLSVKVIESSIMQSP